MKIVKKCNCGKEFNTTIQRINDNRGKYCSRQCQFNGLRINKDAICYICNKKFISKINPKIIKSNICSKKCLIKFRSITAKNNLVKWIKKNKGYNNQKLGLKGMAISYDGYYVYNGIKVHRLIMQEHINRKLLSNEIVHHINHDKLDNRIENLEIVSRGEHNKIHKFLTTVK